MTNTIQLFEVATREKLRFPFKGLVTVEDLWDISLEGLDSIFKTLNSKLKEVKEESLLNTKTAADKELDVKIEIVKHIVSVKVAENNARLKEKEVKEQKQKIMEIMDKKKDESLENKSIEELSEILSTLE